MHKESTPSLVHGVKVHGHNLTVTIEFMGVTPPVYGRDPPSLVGSAMNASKRVLSLQLSAMIRQLMVRCIRTIPVVDNGSPCNLRLSPRVRDTGWTQPWRTGSWQAGDLPAVDLVPRRRAETAERLPGTSTFAKPW